MTPKNTELGLFALALAISMLVASGPVSRPAYACSCAGVPTAEESLRDSDAVFSGEVVEVEEGGPLTFGEYTTFGTALSPVTFDIKESWKGTPEGSVDVYGQGSEASCGMDFDKGKTYLVFAYLKGKGDDGPLETNLCSATTQVNEQAALRMLGPPKGSLPDTGGQPPPPRDDRAAVLALAIALSFVAASALSVALLPHRARRP